MSTSIRSFLPTDGEIWYRKISLFTDRMSERAQDLCFYGLSDAEPSEHINFTGTYESNNAELNKLMTVITESSDARVMPTLVVKHDEYIRLRGCREVDVFRADPEVIEKYNKCVVDALKRSGITVVSFVDPFFATGSMDEELIEEGLKDPDSFTEMAHTVALEELDEVTSEETNNDIDASFPHGFDTHDLEDE